MPKFLEVTDTVAAKQAINADFYVNVKDYGAVGDGVADDTDAIHDARDAAGAGGVVYLPHGIYRTEPLTANVAGQTWRLDDATLEYGASVTQSGITITAADVSIIGGTIDMSAITKDQTAQAILNSGIKVFESGAVIRNVTMNRPATHGVHIIDGDRITVAGCTIIEPAFYGIHSNFETEELELYDFLIEGNRIVISDEFTPDNEEQCGIYLYSGNATQRYNRVVIANNNILMKTGPGLGPSGILVWKGFDVAIHGNVIVGGWAGITNATNKRLSITGNTISSFNTMGIEVGGAQDGLTISGNVIDAQGFNASGAAGISFSGSGVLGGGPGTVDVENVVITGNRVGGFTASSTPSKGVELGSQLDIKDVAITGNTIAAGGGSGTFDGVLVTSPSTNLSITGNLFDGGSRSNSRAVHVPGHAHVGMSITSNNFSNCAASACALVATNPDAPGSYAGVRYTGNLVRNCGASVESDGFTSATGLVVDTATSSASTPTAASTTTLTVDSAEFQRFTGTAEHTIVLPTTLVVTGHRVTIANSSTKKIVVNASGLALVTEVPPNSTARFVAAQATPTLPAHWLWSFGNQIQGRLVDTSLGLGPNSQASLTSGTSNTAVGVTSQQSLTTGASNTAVGRNAQLVMTSGSGNTAIGSFAHVSMTTGDANTSVGDLAQADTTSGGYNSALGASAARGVTTGNYNTVAGYVAAFLPDEVGANKTTDGSRQTVIGAFAGLSGATQHNDITTVGFKALAGGTAATALGASAKALHANSVALGDATQTTATNQVAIGARSLLINDTTVQRISTGIVGVDGKPLVLGDTNVTTIAHVLSGIYPRSYVSGQYYAAAPTGQRSTGAVLQGSIRVYPYVVTSAVTINRLWAECTAAQASSYLRVGIWGTASDGSPGALVLDGGLIDCATTGIKEVTVTSTTLQPGLYFFGGASQDAASPGPTLRIQGASQPFPQGPLGSTLPTGTGFSSWNTTDVPTSSGSGFPSTSTNWQIAAGVSCPFVGFKVA